MIEILKPSTEKLGLGHIYKKRDFYPVVFDGDFKGMLVINVNPCVCGSNANFEAQHLYVCRDKFITSPTQGRDYIAACTNEKLNNKIFQFVSYKNDMGLINICVEGENLVSTIHIFNTCYEVQYTTDEKLINDGVEKVDDLFLECYVREQNDINRKPQEPVSDWVKQQIRPYMLQLIHDVSEYVERVCATGEGSGFDLDDWMKTNIK